VNFAAKFRCECERILGVFQTISQQIFRSETFRCAKFRSEILIRSETALRNNAARNIRSE